MRHATPTPIPRTPPGDVARCRSKSSRSHLRRSARHAPQLADTVPTAMRAARSARKAIDAGRDRRKGKRCQLVRGGKIERACGSSRASSASSLVAAAVPHRADGMDDVPRLEPVAARDFGRRRSRSRRASRIPPQFRSRGAMDGAVDAAAAQQRAVGGVDDRIDSSVVMSATIISRRVGPISAESRGMGAG